MERLWSPWRLAYLTSAKDASGSACIFCSALARAGTEPLVLLRGRSSFVILNLYPYNNGHLMVVSNRHVGTLAELSTDEMNEMMLLTQRAEIAITEAYRPEGLNVGINLGRPAGAGVTGHIHIHVVPRWEGDTNFMSVIGEVRVLPEELGLTAGRLKPIFDRLSAGGA